MSICESFKNSVERAIRNADLSSVIKGTVFVMVAILLMCGGFLLALRGNAASAGATYVAAVFWLVFAFLSQFKKFSGLGFAGETWERKMQEADELITQLRRLAVVVTEPLLMLVPRMGRWDSALTRKEQYEIITKIEDELKQRGISAKDIDKAKGDIHRYVIEDLATPIMDGVCRVAQKKADELCAIMQSFPQPREDDPEFVKAVEPWKAAVAAMQTLQAVRGVSPPEEIPEALLKAVAECPLLTVEQRASLLDRYREEIFDLEHYAKHHLHRRLSVWLEGS